MTSLQRAVGQDGSPTNSAAAWLRLTVAVVLSTIGGVGMWSVMVALPAIQADFGVEPRRRLAALHPGDARLRAAAASLMGRLADRFGIAVPLAHRHAGVVGSAISRPDCRRACGRSRSRMAC